MKKKEESISITNKNVFLEEQAAALAKQELIELQRILSKEITWRVKNRAEYENGIIANSIKSDLQDEVREKIASLSIKIKELEQLRAKIKFLISFRCSDKEGGVR